jgi:hypothetical protein
MAPLSNYYNNPEINNFIIETNGGILRYNKCLALIGNKEKTKKALNKMIDQIGVENYYQFDNNMVISRWENDENSESIIQVPPGPIVNERSIFNKKMVVFKPENIPLEKMTGHLKSYICGDEQMVYIRNNEYLNNTESEEYDMISGVFESNFVIELTCEDYKDACIGLKRKLQAVYL